MPEVGNERYDYILIWGHGLVYVHEILSMIREDLNFEIKKIIYHKPKSVRKIIDIIYSYDYAPIEHLKYKTKYLELTSNEVIFIFIENKKPTVDLLGEGAFRHEESLTLKDIKEAIRNKYNPYKDGIRTEDHVVHASDNELQTDYILRYLGFHEGINIFNDKNKFISCPNYMNQVSHFIIKEINISSLVCNMATGLNRYNFAIKMTNLQESPHYKGLSEDIDIYKNYIDKFLGGPLTEDYYPEKFITLSKKFRYLEEGYSDSYVLVRKHEGKFLILDGLHRASILASRSVGSLTVGEVME